MLHTCAYNNLQYDWTLKYVNGFKLVLKVTRIMFTEHEML